MHTPLVSLCALEVWRASGKRTLVRLRELVRHFAETNAESEYVEHFYLAAVAAAYTWEIEGEI